MGALFISRELQIPGERNWADGFPESSQMPGDSTTSNHTDIARSRTNEASAALPYRLHTISST
jgi:hypothetical protein